VNGKIVGMREHVVTKGKPCWLGLADCLGLVLDTPEPRIPLCSPNGVWSFPFCLMFISKFSLRLLFRVLKEKEDAKVSLPTAQEIAEYQEVDRTNFPALDCAWCVMDGLKVQIQKWR